MNYEDHFIFLGSCFSENISAKMANLGFDIIVNPLGIMYNPKSIERSLKLLEASESLDQSMFLQRENEYFHFDFHSSRHARERELLIDLLNEKQSKFIQASSEIEGNQYLFITLGTAWVFRHKKSGRFVANCHKQLASEFDKILLEENEIVQILSSILEPGLHPNRHIVFTVSPIRHVKDGFHENQVSKSRLISAVYSIVQNHEKSHYFPAFELMMDDLRDYRFYKADLLHPNEMAIDYIWNSFKESCFSNVTQSISQEYEKLLQMKNHRPLFPDSAEARQFNQTLANKLMAFQEKYPQVKMTKI